MLIVLYFAYNLFNVDVDIFNMIITTGLKYLTPVAVVSLVLFIIFSLMTSKIVETIIGVIVGGLILYFIFTYLI